MMEEMLQLQGKIQSLDPLGADAIFAQLPTWNTMRNVQGLIDVTHSVLPSLETVAHFDQEEAHAAMRDLGMLMSAIKRHGCEPCQAIPALKPVMMLLGEKLKTVPRDTIVDYSLWNPDEPRRRRYTSTADETALIESVQLALSHLYLAIDTMEKVLMVEPLSPEFVTYCNELNSQLEFMVLAIVRTIKQVSPQTFAHQLRVFWEPIEIGGVKYDGAGAAQLPICIIDHFFWASDRGDSSYTSYYAHTLQYVACELRQLYEANATRPSFTTQLGAALAQCVSFTPLQKEALLAVSRILATLIKFRQPHKKLAYVTYEERYKIDPTVMGSSGHRPEILPHIADLTRNARAYLMEQYKACEEQRNQKTREESKAA
ncbi:MAG TPA: monodechloroaminopyrrolnitrin synthase PrnB family protein [Ktedonobacteraceae bacterium]|nr:monodechloroaminopyrrolnitrin synthase PrnB family protein [Ktedonobacteraceae bacterium]